MYTGHEGTPGATTPHAEPAPPAGRMADERPLAPPLRERAVVDRMASALLDVLDVGLVIVDADLRVLYANRASRHAGSRSQTLLRGATGLHLQDVAERGRLERAVRQACVRDRRSLVTIGTADGRLTLGVVPLGGGDGLALLILGRHRPDSVLTLELFAQMHRITRTERVVLEGLCQGYTPVEIAAREKVQLSTVRTHIGHLRAKTGAERINTLMLQVVCLPPMFPLVVSRT